MAACLAAALLFGVSTPIAKSLLEETGPTTLAGLLYLGAAAGVLPVALRGRKQALRGSRVEARRLGGVILFGGLLGPVLLLQGLRLAPAASVSLWLNLETPATAFLATLFFREHLDRRAWGAVALALLGGGILAAPSAAAGPRSAILVGLACLCWGLDNNLTALVGGFTPAQTTLAKGLGAGCVNVTLGALLGERVAGLEGVLAALAVGAVSYGLSILLYVSGAQELGASRAQLLFSTSPFLGCALAWSAWGEPVRAPQIAAGVFMAVALALLLTGRHAHEHTHERILHTHSHRHDDDHHAHSHPGLPAWTRHTHPHEHEPAAHAHPHLPDLHHRHVHKNKEPTRPGGS